LIEIALERVEPFFPEPPVALEPVGCLLERPRRERALDDPAFLPAREEPGALENSQVLHETRERHRRTARELADRRASRCEALDDRAARRIGERREDGVEPGRQIVNHWV
jgi:hypothetical protein